MIEASDLKDWRKGWLWREPNSSGVRAYYDGQPLWMVAGALSLLFTTSFNVDAMEALLDIAEHGDWIARWRALAIIEFISPFDPTYIKLINWWSDTVQSADEIEHSDNDEWTASHVIFIQKYVQGIQYRLHHYGEIDHLFTGLNPQLDALAKAEPKPDLTGLGKGSHRKKPTKAKAKQAAPAPEAVTEKLSFKPIPIKAGNAPPMVVSNRPGLPTQAELEAIKMGVKSNIIS